MKKILIVMLSCVSLLSCSASFAIPTPPPPHINYPRPTIETYTCKATVQVPNLYKTYKLCQLTSVLSIVYFPHSQEIGIYSPTNTFTPYGTAVFSGISNGEIVPKKYENTQVTYSSYSRPYPIGTALFDDGDMTQIHINFSYPQSVNSEYKVSTNTTLVGTITAYRTVGDSSLQSASSAITVIADIQQSVYYYLR